MSNKIKSDKFSFGFLAFAFATSAIAINALPNTSFAQNNNAPATKPATTTATTVAPNAATNATTAVPDAAAIAASLDALKAKFTNASEFYNQGNTAEGIKIWQDVYVSADKTPDQQKIAKEAARRLGFFYLENQDPRSAEAYFAAEASIARRLFLTGNLTPIAYSKSVADWASGAGAMGRSSESAALVYFSTEIKARAKAASSQAVLNREASFLADEIEGVRVYNDGLCVINNVAILSKQVNCTEEANARQEALTYHARQIKANAPAPEKKEKKEDEK